MEPQRPQVGKAVTRKKNKVGDVTHPDFRVYYEIIVIKTIWYQTHRPMEQNTVPQNKLNTYTAN